MTVEEAIVFDAEAFTLKMELLAERMGGHVDRPGFSEGYYTLHAHGEVYTFTKMQAAILEVMDKGGRMHQHAITAQAGSQQDNLKSIFKNKSGYHPVWNKIIKNDGKGHYWLEY